MRKPQVLVVAGVLAAHALVLWAVQIGFAPRAVPAPSPQVVSISVLPQLPQALPPKPAVQRPLPPPLAAPPAQSKPPLQALPLPLKPSQAAQTIPLAAAPVPAAAPAAPLPVAVATANGNAPLALPSSVPLVVSAATSTAPAAAPVATPTATALPSPAPARVVLPSTTADYLNNPQPVYPPLSERRREHGRVLLTVVVDVQGRAKSVGITSSSGFDRLDQAAQKAVKGWTFVPGKRDGVSVEMAVEVPIRFQLPP